MRGLLYSFPKAAAYGRSVPKSKIIEHSTSSRRLKQLFVDEVESIDWSYKISPETVNLPSANDVYEIQIITIVQRKPDLNADVLKAVDNVVPSRIIFVLMFNNKLRYAAAFKRRSEADKSKQVISNYFYSDCISPDEAPVVDLPVALNLSGLYERMLQSIVSIDKKDDETIPELIERYDMIQKLNKEIAALEKKMLSQKQFNRKVEMNGDLKRLQEKLGELV